MWFKYPQGRQRLRLETNQMRFAAPHFDLCIDDQRGCLLWCGSLYSHGHYHRDIRLIYAPNHAIDEMRVFILKPKLNPRGKPRSKTHIHGDGSICYCKPHEWHAGWTAAAVYGKTIEFLDAFYSGLMEKEDFDLGPSYRRSYNFDYDDSWDDGSWDDDDDDGIDSLLRRLRSRF